MHLRFGENMGWVEVGIGMGENDTNTVLTYKMLKNKIIFFKEKNGFPCYMLKGWVHMFIRQHVQEQT